MFHEIGWFKLYEEESLQPNWFNYKGCIDMQQPEFKPTFCILKLTGHTFVIKDRWTIHLWFFRDKVNLHLVHGVIDFDSVTYYFSDIQNVSLTKISFLINVITEKKVGQESNWQGFRIDLKHNIKKTTFWWREFFTKVLTKLVNIATSFVSHFSILCK